MAHGNHPVYYQVSNIASHTLYDLLRGRGQCSPRQ